jgi:hypothetical protein
MPRQEIILNVFVGSPGDVAEERESLESIVTELNKSWSRNLGLRLELVLWETDVQPGFGIDPQDVINKQIGEEYDIFIGIFWGRIGTETKRAQSGTIEEFQRAYAKYKSNEDSIDLLLYFKDAAIPPSKIDTSQMAELMGFKSSLGELGGLYWEFETIGDFEATLRSHLSALAQKWSRKSGLKSSEHYSVEKNAGLVSEQEDEDEYGFLDHLEAFDNLNSDMCSALNHMSEATVKIGENMNIRTEAMNVLGELDEKSNYSDVKKVIKLASEDMERYSSVLNVQLPIFANSKNGALDALSKALVVYKDFDVDKHDLNSLDENIKQMREAAIGSKVGLSQFRETIVGLPRITTQFNKAKNGVTRSLDGVLNEIGATIQVTQNIIDSITELKAEIGI